jgi:hypothetical protein
MQAYAQASLGDDGIKLADATRLIAIGSDAMMAAIARARGGALQPYLHLRHDPIASINSPMQCMMKEICGQCLQRDRDPLTNEEAVVFSCAGQDQPLDRVDFQNLRARLRQNSVQEKLTRRWIEFASSSKSAVEIEEAGASS